MWNREQLKAKGKTSFKANYWKAVLLALVLSIVAGGYGLAAGTSSATTAGTAAHRASWNEGVTYTIEGEDALRILEGIEGVSVDVSSEDGTTVYIGEDGIRVTDADGNTVVLRDEGVMAEIIDELDLGEGDIDDLVEFVSVTRGIGPAAGAAVFIAFLLVFLVAIALALAFDAFLVNPVEVGGKRFFICNLNRKAEVKEVAFAFDHNYLNGVKTMILRDVYVILWSLLLIVPGIVKCYEYRMIPYIIAENPEMEHKQAFAMSKQMMTGQKWRAFVLDLSFIGWWLLSLITLGIVEVLYVGPYYQATCAALYEALRYGGKQPADYQQDPVFPQHSQGYAPQPPSAYMADQPAWATEPVAQQTYVSAAIMDEEGVADADSSAGGQAESMDSEMADQSR